MRRSRWDQRDPDINDSKNFEGNRDFDDYENKKDINSKAGSGYNKSRRTDEFRSSKKISESGNRISSSFEPRERSQRRRSRSPGRDHRRSYKYSENVREKESHRKDKLSKGLVKEDALVSDEYKPGMIMIKNKWVYPEDEKITLNGTWEHKKRQEEMEKTEAESIKRTELARGSHHIADFLPKGQLEEFNRRISQIKSNSINPSNLQPSMTNPTIEKSNVGFRLLQKQGWDVGQGLGSTSQGITAPIISVPSESSSAGLGQTHPHEITPEDDEFDLYRKKMMLAYKYRPNPLNNPRRQYY
ncbi:SURP and G-patch domain-containing protein 1 [Smittium mucronatum]|uniref:SURP and G-patch domain-containing protein 1 n=1 Tax=Smittium mucronatum TaxID=133383 RepID=A0A1R0H5L7_9FUNG|nr:SURP and G-patch domain-containing protein 1 [Smittium mucronatum]